MEKICAYLLVGLVLSQAGLIVLGAGLIASWGSALSVGCGLFMMVTNWTLVNRVTGPTLVKARVTRQPTVARF